MVCNQQVVGSSPTSGSKNKAPYPLGYGAFVMLLPDVIHNSTSFVQIVRITTYPLWSFVYISPFLSHGIDPAESFLAEAPSV